MFLHRAKLSRSQVAPVGEASVQIPVVGVVPTFVHITVRIHGWEEVHLGALKWKYGMHIHDG